MPPGKRQSPFIGKLVLKDGILYPRYSSLDDILLEPGSAHGTEESGKKAGKEKKAKRKAGTAAAEKATVPTSGHAEGHKKKRRKSDAAAEDVETPPAEAQAAEGRKLSKKQRKATAAAAELANGHAESPAAAAAGEPAPAAKRKKDKPGKKAAKRIAAPSGPGNEQQAQQMRSILGLPVAGEPAAAPSTAPGSFSFGFAPTEEAAEAEEPEEEPQAAAAAADRSVQGGAPAAAAADEAEDPELRARLRRVMGQGPELVPRRVFVGGMPFYYDEEQVREYWSYCGEIEELDLLRFPDTGRFRGIAFITFADEAGYAEALKCDGETIEEQQLKVKPCTADAARRGRGEREQPTREARRRHSEPAPKTPGYHVAYVGNVAFEASPAQLRDLFEGCSVSFVRLHTDKATGKSKGYAHVHFSDEASLDRALDFDGTLFMGREIKVGYAQPKKA